jgi:hypothetical protein
LILNCGGRSLLFQTKLKLVETNEAFRKAIGKNLKPTSEESLCKRFHGAEINPLTGKYSQRGERQSDYGAEKQKASRAGLRKQKR